MSFRAPMALLIASLVAAGVMAQRPAADGPAPPAMVFFDWGKDEVRRDDGETLDKIAEAWRGRPAAQLRLAGPSDRSGGAAVNRAAGVEGARTVRGQLEKRGVPRN